MAKASAKASRKIKVNMEGVENFTPPPESDYKIGIAEVTKEKGSESDKEYLSWTLEIAEGKHKGKKLYYNTSLQPQALWNLRGVLEAFGIDVPEGVMEVDLDEIEACETLAGCTVEHENYEGKNKARVSDIFSLEDRDVEGAEGGDTSGDDVSEEDIMAMDEDDLGTFVEENDLEVELGDFKKLSAKRKAVARAYAEAKAAAGNAGEGGTELPSDEEINAMDEDELKEVIEELELDVDLDDYKTLKKQISAVKKAVEEKKEAGDEPATDDDAITEESIEAMGKSELAAFIKEHKLKVTLEGNTSKQRRVVIAAAKKAELIEE